jgi:hypothetical protein
MDEEKTQTLSQNKKPKSRAFYYLDGILVRLSLIVIIIALLWNWDGFWRTDIKFLDTAQQTYFPIKYETERIKTEAMNNNTALYNKMSEKDSQFKKETDKFLKSIEAEEEKLIATKKKAAALLRYYDTSLRMIKQLQRKFSPDEFEEILKCNSSECEDIISSSPGADPETYSF